jgi:uncharacterized membrane protein
MDENTVITTAPATNINDGNIATGIITADKINTTGTITTATTTIVKQSRWKSAVLWTAIVAQVIALLQLTGAFKAMGLDEGYVGNVCATILQVLVILGIINNPENPTAL